jgi:hypothetical protein
LLRSHSQMLKLPFACSRVPALVRLELIDSCPFVRPLASVEEGVRYASSLRWAKACEGSESVAFTAVLLYAMRE